MATKDSAMQPELDKATKLLGRIRNLVYIEDVQADGDLCARCRCPREWLNHASDSVCEECTQIVFTELRKMLVP
jgi:hypothetical protein